MSAAVKPRVRGLALWLPQHATLMLLATVQSVLTEYAAFLPLTIRQIFYRLVGAHGYDKTEQAYSRLGEHLNRARRAGLIEFSAIRDDGIMFKEPLSWDSPQELVRTFLQRAANFRLDRQTGQDRRRVFAVESAGMVPQIERIAAPFGIAVHSSGGFDSLTAKRDLAERLGQWPRVEVLHIGDHDPNGVHLYFSMADDVPQIAEDLGLESDILFSRLAVTPAQIRTLRLPTAPAKPTDRRSFEGETVQCEAIPPDVLAQIVTAAITDRLDRGAYELVLRRETRIRAALTERLDTLLDENWDGTAP